MYLAQFDHIDFRRDVIREGLTLYYNSDEKIKQQARKRLPDIKTSEFYFHEWFLKATKKNPESLPELHSYEKDFYNFHQCCDELLEMAEEHIALDIFENKIKEIIRISTELTHSMVKISSEKIIEEFKPQ